MDDDDTHVALAAFVDWFSTNGGYLDVDSVRFKTFPISEGGRCMVASRDIEEGQTLFSIPRRLMLSTENCSLPSLFGLEEWKKMELDKGWTGMILCMMWEQAKGKASKWSEYLSILPDRFDTPMFWDRNDLYELEGTVVVEKIGKDQANQEYLKKILPALQSRTDIFPLDTWTSEYSLETYHIMGSRILSRSFHVEPWHDASEDSVDANPEDTNEDVDATLADSPRDADIPGETDAEEDEEGVNVAMVPMADMLNARFESENVCMGSSHLQPRDLTIVTVQAVPRTPLSEDGQHESYKSRRTNMEHLR
ncbi:hypothetical protein AX15_003242 [Amanita polypyramis BW_CC]|nr:hypothetical protein AX15_003242 [Amanita polypyramis BW_CC]